MNMTEKLEKLEAHKLYSGSDVFATDDTIIDFINPETGKTCICGETFEQVQACYPDAKRTTLEAFSTGKGAEQDKPVIWIETTADRYSEMLGVLPPAFMGNFGFLVGEPWDHHAVSGEPRYSAFRYISGKYIESDRPMTIREFKAL